MGYAETGCDGAVYLCLGSGKSLPGLEVHGGEWPAPNAACIEGVDVLNRADALQGGPMTENNGERIVFALPVGVPRLVTEWYPAGSSLVVELHEALGVAEAYTGQIVGDNAQAFVPLELGFPACRFVAVHVLKEEGGVGAA